MNRKNKITIRFDDIELEILQNDINKIDEKMDKSKYIREVLFNKNKPIIIESKSDKNNKLKMIAQTKKIGNNINQLAHSLNVAKNENSLNKINFKNLYQKLISIDNRLEELQNDS